MKYVCKRNEFSRSGIVLIVVLVLVMMVAFAGFGFLASMTIEYDAAKINGQILEAQQTLASAETLLIWTAELPPQQRQSLGEQGIANSPELFRGRGLFSVTTTEATTSDDSQFPGSTNRWQFSVIHFGSSLSQSNLQFGLQDESAKLNLELVLRWEKAEAGAGAGKAALMQLPGMSETIADSLLDWLDEDDVPRAAGAEAEYYQRLEKPYQPRNGIPIHLDELLFVKGISRSLLYGSKNGEQGNGEDEINLGESNRTPVWSDLLTCRSAEYNLNSQGNSKINLNSTDLAALQKSLTEHLDEPLVRYIILARQHGISLPNNEQANNDQDSQRSQSTARIRGSRRSRGSSGQRGKVSPSTNVESKFTIASPASLIDSFVEVQGDENDNQRVASPLQSSTPDFHEKVAVLFSQTTTELSENLIGRININLASEEVLKTIPEMTPEIASQIIQQRTSLNEMEKRSTAWLISRQVVDVAQYRKWYAYLTTGGDVFTGEIVVFRTTGGPFLRRKLTIDASKRPVSTVDWIDLTDQGLPVPLPMLSKTETESTTPFANPTSNQ